MMKARNVIEKAPEKSRNIAKFGTLIDMIPVNNTIKHRYTMLLNYRLLVIKESLTLGKDDRVGNNWKIYVFSEISKAGKICSGKEARRPKLYIKRAVIVRLL